MATESVERLITMFRSNRERLESFCRALSEEQLERAVPNSSWRVKDFVAHLATLDTELIRWFEAVMAGKTKAPALNPDGTPFDVDRWNDAAVAERKDWTLDEVLEEAEPNRERFLEMLERMTDEHLEQVVHFAGDNKRDPADVPFKLFLFGLARHDPIHVADMLKALPERSADPDLKAWLDDPAVKWYQDVMSGPPKR